MSIFTGSAKRWTATLGMSALAVIAVSPDAFAADQVPYDDPGATGTITLCDRDLKPITEGSVNDLPFIWRSVGSEAAPPPYNDQGRRAVLYAFQPRKGVSPGEWTGEQQTAASTYTNVDHPMAQSTVLDFPLRIHLENYPPDWDGFVQLRLYYTSDGVATSADYAATDIQVVGDRWEVVGSQGSAACDSGDAVSPEIFTVPNFKKSAKAVEAKIARMEAKEAQTASPSASQSASTQEVDPSGKAGEPSSVSAAEPASSDSNAPVIIVAALLALVAVVGAVVWRRRTR